MAKRTKMTSSKDKNVFTQTAKKINRASAEAGEAVLNELRKTTHQSIQSK